MTVTAHEYLAVPAIACIAAALIVLLLIGNQRSIRLQNLLIPSLVVLVFPMVRAHGWMDGSEDAVVQRMS